MVNVENALHLPPIDANTFDQLPLRPSLFAHRLMNRQFDRDTKRRSDHRLGALASEDTCNARPSSRQTESATTKASCAWSSTSASVALAVMPSGTWTKNAPTGQRAALGYCQSAQSASSEKLVASNGGCDTAAAFSRTVRSNHWPARFSNTSRVRRSGSTSQACLTPWRA